MRTYLRKLVPVALPLAVLVMSGCSSHHRFHPNYNAWHDETYGRGSYGYQYEERGPYNGRERYSDGRYGGGDRWPWLRW
jgi:hypothetical protein